MTASFLVAGTAALFAAQAAPAQEAPEPPPATLRVVRAPTDEELEFYYPRTALEARVAGLVSLRCFLGLGGVPRNCGIVEESPAGYGFGAAALAASTLYRLDGPASQTGTRVTFRLDFQCPDCEAGGTRSLAIRDGELFYNVFWEAAPSVDQWRSAYPAGMRHAPADALTMLRCRFAEGGRLTGCEVSREEPVGSGAGDAALSLVPHFVGPSVTTSGRPTADGIVELTVAFPAALATDAAIELSEPGDASFPSQEQIAATFPTRAREAGVTSGVVDMTCERGPDGRIGTCTIVEESETGMGFADAARSLARAYRFSPWGADGRPTRTTIPLNVVLTDGPSGQQLLERLDRAMTAENWSAAEAAARALLARPDTRSGFARYQAVLGQVLLIQGKVAEGLDELRKAASLQPTNPELWNTLCWEVATRTGAAEEAVAMCDLAISITPTNPSYYDSRGFARLKAGDLTGALEDYDRSLRTRPSSAYSLMGRGVVRLRLGQTEAGRTDIDAARQIDPSIESRFAGYGVRP